MKIRSLILGAVMALASVAMTGCGAEGLHKPTTVGNAPIVGNVGYGALGITARQVLGMGVCETPPVYPCVSQAIKNRVYDADTVAYKAAVVIDSASATAQQKQDAADKAKALKSILDEPDIKKQTDLAAEKERAAQH